LEQFDQIELAKSSRTRACVSTCKQPGASGNLSAGRLSAVRNEVALPAKFNLVAMPPYGFLELA